MPVRRQVEYSTRLEGKRQRERATPYSCAASFSTATMAARFSSTRLLRRSRAALVLCVDEVSCLREGKGRERDALDATCLHLVGKDLGAGLLGLGLVDVVHENSAVAEDATLALEVELVVAVRPSNHCGVGWR